MAKTQKKPVTQYTVEIVKQAVPAKQGRKERAARGAAEVIPQRNSQTIDVKEPSAVDVSIKIPSPSQPAPHSKQGIMITLLQSTVGATIEELAEATGWQRHSVHGVMSGVLKKKLGLSITSDKEERGRVYRIAGA